MKKICKLSKIIGFFTIFLIILQLVVANKLVLSGFTLSEMLLKKESLKSQNEILETKIADFSSLSKITYMAKELGFGNPQILYLNTHKAKVALKVN